MARFENMKVFNDTRMMYQDNEALRSATEDSASRQKMIPEAHVLPDAQPRYDMPAQLVVSKKRTYEAASAYTGQRVCVLNFASSVSPGGGVVHGANAQEECLCRCSNLYGCLNRKELWDSFYLPHRAKRNPLHDDDCIYTPDVVVFKTDTKAPVLMEKKDWYKVNVLTCAAPNLRGIPANPCNPGEGDVPVCITDEELYRIHLQRTRRILHIAALNDNDVLILGAFGCGAFLNNPRVVSRAMTDAVWEYRKMFKTIEFAVYCSDWDARNYDIFRETVERKTAE